MADGQQQEGQGGGQGYTDNDIELLLNETAKRAAAEALKSSKQHDRQPRGDEYEEDELIGINPKLVKQLQTTVGVFNTLKEFSSNPLQKAIETKVGELAAGVIEHAFSRPSGPPPKRDLVETLLNSQFAFGLGNGLGQRAPELVESMGKTFGQDKAEQMIDGIIGQYGKGRGGQGQIVQEGNRQLNTSPSSAPSGPSPEQKVEKSQTEKELLLSLDPNNPEHVAAYAESQGGISVDVARKMLMIHQDEFIKQIKNQGNDISQISTTRGSHIEKQSQQPVKQEQEYSQQPVQHVQQTQEYSQQQPQSEMEYADFQEIPQQEQTIPHIEQRQRNSPGENHQIQDMQQTEVMKQFADDIGKIMENMVNKIETINNTVFVLQNEIGEIRRRDVATVTPPGVLSQSDHSIINEHESVTPYLEDQTLAEQSYVQEEQPRIPEEAIRVMSKYSHIKRSEDFFDETVHDTGDFFRDLEKDAKVDTKKSEEEKEKQQTLSVQLPIQQVPSPTIYQTSPSIINTDITTSQLEENPKGLEEKDQKLVKEKKLEGQKKFARPIRKSDVYKGIYAPSFKPNDLSEDDNDNRDIDIKEV